MTTTPSPADPVIQRVFAGSAPGGQAWRLHGGAASRRVEAGWQSRLAAHALMQRAGLAVARLALATAPHAQRIQVVAGGGNNGGDGLEAAMHLRRLGRPVAVALLGDAGRLPPDAAASLARAREAGVAIQPGLPQARLEPGDLAIDALLGLGISRPPGGSVAQAIAWLNACTAGVLAIDLPSGLDADTGWLDAPADTARCVRADHCLSLLTLKPSLFTAHGRDQSGDVWFCDLGVPAEEAPDALLAGREAARLQPRRHAQHKGSFGNVHVVGGAAGMRGAALLAARAALHTGAGRVYLQWLEPDAVLDPAIGVDPLVPELMIRRSLDIGTLGTADVVACGCGGGSAVAAALPALLGRAPALVLDADALNAVAVDEQLRTQLAARRTRGWITVLTPHPLEAARLLGCRLDELQSDRLGRARDLAQALGAVVVLKGSGTVVATPDDQPPSINASGNALLGSAGTGDVLAGWIAALCAQGLAGADAARAAVYLHGLQADRWLAAHSGQPLSAGQLLPVR